VLLAGELAIDALETANLENGPGGAAFLDDAKRPTVVFERRLVERPSVAVCIPALNSFEKTGTFTNVDGLAQALRPSLDAPPGALADREALERLREAVYGSAHAAAKGAH